MMEKTPFSVSVNDTELTIAPEAIQDLDTIEIMDGYFHILKDNKAFKAEVLETNFADKSLIIKVNGNTYTVKIADKFDRLVKQIGLTVGATQKMNLVKSPMPGLVLHIMVEEGQAVAKGETLLILEAMKMENAIKAPADAVIKSINVTKGMAIEKGQLLIEFNL
jgi:biotin carboxyl carrier protein